MSEFVPSTIALRIGLGHAMESFIVERRLCGSALTDCSGPQAAGRRVVSTSPLIKSPSLRRRGSSRERFDHLVSDVHRWRSHNGILKDQVVLFLLEDLPDRTERQVL